MPRTNASPATMRFAVSGELPFLSMDREEGLDLLDWLGLGRPEFGLVAVADLLPRCRRRMWPEPRNVDPPHRGRPAGSLRARCERVAAALERRHTRMVHFG